jgi:hypothetical protein
LYASVENPFLTEFSNKEPLPAYSIEKIMKLRRFVEEAGSAPLYEEKSTMVESITTIVVKTKIKTSEVFLLSVDLKYRIFSAWVGVGSCHIKTSRICHT